MRSIPYSFCWNGTKNITNRRSKLACSKRTAATTRPQPSTDAAAVGELAKFDVVMAWSVDRLGRSLQDLVAFLGELHALGVDLFLHQQGLDTTTPAGKAMFQIMGVFAEFERAIIQERVQAICLVEADFRANRLEVEPCDG
jgi:DNA invertase Pin-like site-specific DNA recombinase